MKITGVLPRPSRLLATVLTAWLLLAVAAAAAGLLARSPVPPPAIAFALTGLALLALWLSPSLRTQTRGLGARSLVAIHFIRLPVGIYFLWLYGRGMLPGEFAVPAGWGDIVVGAAALLVWWLCVPAQTAARRGVLLGWNAAGLLDILLVLANGARLFTAEPQLGERFTTLPLALLPLFIVPLVIVSHILIFAWYRNQKMP